MADGQIENGCKDRLMFPRRNKTVVSLIALVGLLLSGVGAVAGEAGAGGQIAVPRIEQMPNLPSPLKIRDWRQVARDYDALVFDLTGPRRASAAGVDRQEPTQL